MRDDGWSGLFATAFRQSRNAMTLVDEQRRHVDVNGPYLKLLGYAKGDLTGMPISRLVAGGPQASPEEWSRALARGRFDGESDLIRADGATVTVSWGASAETVTGRRLVLFVVLSAGLRERRARTPAPRRPDGWTLSRRQREVVRLVALGHTGPEIAGELQIAHDTVRTHVRNAMTTSGARSRAHLVALALGGGHALG